MERVDYFNMRGLFRDYIKEQYIDDYEKPWEELDKKKLKAIITDLGLTPIIRREEEYYLVKIVELGLSYKLMGTTPLLALWSAIAALFQQGFISLSEDIKRSDQLEGKCFKELFDEEKDEFILGRFNGDGEDIPCYHCEREELVPLRECEDYKELFKKQDEDNARLLEELEKKEDKDEQVGESS